MKVTGKGILNDLKANHADDRSQVDSWIAEAEEAEWENTRDIKQRYPKASFCPRNQVVFDLKGNRYRIWTIISYKNKTVFTKKAGTHEEYMKWVII